MKRGTRPRFLSGSSLRHTVTAPIVQLERLIPPRPNRMNDAARWREIQLWPDVLACTSWPKRTAEQSRAHLKNRAKHMALRHADVFLALALEH